MKEISLKRSEISKRLSQLENLSDRELISVNRYTNARRRLIAELHTLDYVLDNQKNMDSDEWFKKLLKGGSNE